jgi:hypothetical protein
MELSPSPVPSSTVVRSPVTEPRSFAGPPFVHGSTDLPRSPVRFPVPLSFVLRSLNLHRSPVRLSFTGPRTCLAHQSAFPIVYGSTHLCRSPFPASSVLHRFSVPLSFPGPHILSLTGPWTCLVHRFPLPLCFIDSHFPCCSSVPCRCTMCECVCVCVGEGGVLYVPTSLTSYSIPPSLT